MWDKAEGLICTHLVRVTVEIKVLEEAGGELAEERVVRLVDGSQAPIGVVVGAGARTEPTHYKKKKKVKKQCHYWDVVTAIGEALGLILHTCPEGSGLPVVVVVCEAREAR